MQGIADLLREAAYAAAAAGHEVVARSDVQAAIEAQQRRRGRIRERLLDEIARGTVLIDTQGEAVALAGDHEAGSLAALDELSAIGHASVCDLATGFLFGL